MNFNLKPLPSELFRGLDDVHPKLEMCRAHFEKCGLGGDFVKQFIR
jgi:2,4'-dihydroxyacetophenone dioxygenase